MNIKKKILLGSKDVITRTNEDLFINLDLSRTINEIRSSTLNNNFNQSEQFEKENQDSLMFCVYGTVESKKGDADNVKINISSEEGTILYSPNIITSITSNTKSSSAQTISTIPLSRKSVMSKNLYLYNKGAYYFQFEISRLELEKEIEQRKKSGDLIRSKKLQFFVNSGPLYDFDELEYLFFDSNGDLIPFGENFIDINDEGDVFDVNNNYTFLYNTHWIKKDLNVEGPTNVSFKQFEDDNGILQSQLVTSEGISALIPGSVLQNTGVDTRMTVALDKPSKYGRESVKVRVKSKTTIDNPNPDFIFTDYELKWNVGEQEKQVPISIINDFYVEGDEEILFELFDAKNVTIDTPSTFKLIIKDDDLKSEVQFETASIILNEAEEYEVILKLDKPVLVAGQTVDVFINYIGIDDKQKAVVNTDFSIDNTVQTGIYNSFKVEFPIDSTQASFKLNTTDRNDQIFILDKFVGFNIDNPSQNLYIGVSKNFQLTIKDVYQNQYATFTIPTNEEKGYGIFRQDTINKDIIGHSIGPNGYWLTAFTYAIEVINKGERIEMGGKVFEKGDIVHYVNYSGVTSVSGNSYQPFSLTLPTNKDVDSSIRAYKNCMYEFSIKQIENMIVPPSLYANTPYNGSLQQFNTFAPESAQYNFTMPVLFTTSSIAINFIANSLNSLSYGLDYNYGLPGNLSGATSIIPEYYLITFVDNLMNRFEPPAFGSFSTGSCKTNFVVPTNNLGTSTKINGTILLNDYLASKGYNPFGGLSTRITNRFFVSSLLEDTCSIYTDGTTTFLPTTKF